MVAVKSAKELRAELKEKNDYVNGVLNKQDVNGGADAQPLDTETYGKVIDANKRIEELEHEIAEAETKERNQSDIATKARERAQRMNQVIPTVGHGGTGTSEDSANNPRKGDVLSRMAYGAQFMESKSIKDYLASVVPPGGGDIPKSARIQSPSMYLENWSLDRMQQKALVTSTPGGTQGSVLILPEYLPGIVPFPIRPLVMRDIVTIGQTTSDRVEYVRMTDYGTNLAAPVAEATATANASGAKPESSGPNLARIDAYVRTIAHWIPITKRALQDAAQMRTIIDTFLMNGIDQVFEDQMLTGDGTGENFQGILNTPGLTNQPFVNAGPYPILTTLRKARTQALLVGRTVPRAVIMHPSDWETVDLLTDGFDRYLYGGPTEMGTPRVWGLPVVEAQAIPVGTALMADFSTCVLWDREAAAIQMSDSHNDFFVRNMVALLAEARAAFGIMRPAQIVDVALA